MDRYLGDLRQRLAAIEARGSASDADITTLMALIRQHLELRGLQQTYRTLTLYCNWSLHVRLERGIVQDILDQVSAVLADDTPPDYGREVCAALALARLRSEIRAVLEGDGVRSVLFDTYEGWKGFTAVLVGILMGKPLIGRRVPSTPLYAEQLFLRPVDLSGLDPDYVAACSLTESSVMFCVRLGPKAVDLQGPLVLGERAEDFRS